MIFGIAEIVGITTVGVSTFVSTYVLNRLEKQDLANVLVTSVEVGGITFLVYKLVEAIKVVLVLFGI